MQPIHYAHRSAPPKDKRTQYALGIVTLFPSLRDPYSKKGYVSKVFFFIEKFPNFSDYCDIKVIVSYK